LGQAVTFTASISSSAPAGAATGGIQFQVDGTDVGSTVALWSGAAVYVTTLGIGPHLLTASYSGDANFLGSSSQPLSQIVFAYTSGGSFVIGDLSASVGSRVTFWSPQWAALNALSSGAAPSSFKGFTDSVSTNPPVPGVMWTTGGGMSVTPPTSLPSYFAVLVSSSITKSDGTISGNSPQLAVVQTAAGYRPDLGHSGTATVVAVIRR
jgi:hypothetical protein